MNGRWILLNILLPGGLLVSKLFNKRDRFEKWVICRNNKYSGKKRKINIKNILLLLPHCLQNDNCGYRIVKTILNCKSCKKCNIYEIVNLEKKYNINIKVATGGRLAKRIVKELKPDMILAVACERELVEGIYSVYPLEVYGIINLRPEGPCINTKVDVNLIESTIRKFTE